MQNYHEQPKAIRTQLGSRLWPQVAPAVAALLCLTWFFLSITPLPPNDLWWHMAAGRTMLHEGALLTQNRWSYALPADTPYIYQSWLSEIAMYLLWRVGDVPMLSLARMLLITASYGLVAWHAARHTGSGKAAAAALLLAILAGWSNWTLRPQTFALLAGAAFAVALGEFLDGRLSPRALLVALPLLMALWVNLHGSFVLGIALVVLALAGAAAQRVQGRASASLRTLGAASALTVGAALLNPLGIGIFAYVHSMLGNAPLQKWFVEWQSPKPSLNLLDTSCWFFLIVLLITALMALGPKRPSFTAVLWYCALAWLAFGGVRYIMWFALLLTPLMAQQIAPHLSPDRPRPLHPIALAAIALVGIISLPWLQINTLMGAGGSTLFASQGSYRTLMANTTPIGAGEWLAQNPPSSGRMWTNITYASYLEWRTPDIQQFADLRVELFPTDTWEQNFAIAAAKDEGMALIDRWQITTLLLDRRDTKLLARIASDPGWCERYADRDAQIFQRCTS